MDKIDYRKKYHDLYSPASDHAERVVMPAMQFAMIDGSGTPESPEHASEFQSAVGALYGVAYTLKVGAQESRHRAGLHHSALGGPMVDGQRPRV